jgi:hypothetical protein
MTMFEQYTQPAMAEMVSKKEGVIREVLDTCIPGWTMESVRTRCRWVRYAGIPVEFLQIDGEDVLEVHPLQVGDPERGVDRYVMQVSQSYRKLGRAAGQEGGEQ